LNCAEFHQDSSEDAEQSRDWRIEDLQEAIVEGRDALQCMLLTIMEFADPIPGPGSIVSLGVAAGIHDRLSVAAEKRHVRPEKLGSEFIAEALNKEPAA
jgi:hypothetical protein